MKYVLVAWCFRGNFPTCLFDETKASATKTLRITSIFETAPNKIKILLLSKIGNK